MHVIPTTWEAETGRIAVQGQPRQEDSETPSQPTSQARPKIEEKAKMSILTVLIQQSTGSFSQSRKAGRGNNRHMN
jgi:hypothetical protein